MPAQRDDASTDLDLSTVDLLDYEMLERLCEDRRLGELLQAHSYLVEGVYSTRILVEWAKQSIYLALRIDLATLAEKPHLLFQCLYNRLFWHRSAEARLYGVNTPEQAVPLSFLLQNWLKQWMNSPQSKRPKTWAKSLRPPYYPLGLRLKEEYVAPTDYGSIELSHDQETLYFFANMKDNEITAWARSTGQKLSPDQQPSPPAHEPERFSLEVTPNSYTIIDQQTGRSISSMVHPTDRPPTLIRSFGDSMYIFYEVDYDDPAFIARFDPPYAAPTWAVDFTCEANDIYFSQHPSVGLLHESSALYFLDLSSGAIISQWPICCSNALLTGDSRTMVTRQLGVIRVWDCSDLTPTGFYTSLANEGWAEALFSPDSKTVLTGKLLCRTDSIGPIATLPLDGRGYLEGGPPSNGRNLSNTTFVEFNPFRGVQIWNTETGELIFQQRENWQQFRTSDRLEFSKDSRYFVALRDRFRENERAILYCLDAPAGEHVVAELHNNEQVWVRFSPSGHLVLVGTASGLVKIYTLPEARIYMQWQAHEGAVLIAVFSDDEYLLVTFGQDEKLRLWDIRTSQKLAERNLNEDDDTFSAYVGQKSIRVWSGSHEALAQIEGWFGFSTNPHPYRTRVTAGYFEIIDRNSDKLVATLPAETKLLASTTGQHWACRTKQFILVEP